MNPGPLHQTFDWGRLTNASYFSNTHSLQSVLAYCLKNFFKRVFLTSFGAGYFFLSGLSQCTFSRCYRNAYFRFLEQFPGD